MAPVMRSVKLDAAPRRLAHRHAPAPVGKSLPGAVTPVAAVAPVVTPPVIDPAMQRAWQQRMQSELDAARARVEEEGRAAGHAQGLAQARDEFESQHKALVRLIAALTPAVDAQIEGLEDAAIAIAFEATLKLLGDQLATQDGVRAAVQQVLQRVRTNEKASVRLSPADHQLLVQQAGQGLDTTRFELVSDATIDLGGCVVETRAGRIDGSLETQLARLTSTLLSARRAAAAEAGSR